jgi:hypothetical protein
MKKIVKKIYSMSRYFLKGLPLFILPLQIYMTVYNISQGMISVYWAVFHMVFYGLWMSLYFCSSYRSHWKAFLPGARKRRPDALTHRL